MSNFPIRMNTAEAADYLADVHGLRTKKTTLNKLASVGGGPAFQKFGTKRLYTPEALDEWAREKLSPSVRSASELRQRAVEAA